MKTILGGLPAGALLAVLGVTQAIAAEDEAEGMRPIEEIVVTAEKRSQKIQDVPLAITAFTSDTLELRGVETPEDLQAAVPGLTIGKTAIGQAQVTIRGVGTENLIPGGDPGVPVHIDGHYIQSSSWILRDLFDVERVEVLRGPQGTLYGRNATGGNINIITRAPTPELELNLSVDLGNYDKRLVQGVISGPFSDSLRGRLAFSGERRDGYVTNQYNGDDYQDSHYQSVRGTIEYDVTDNLGVTLRGYTSDDKGLSRVNRVLQEFPQDDTLPGGTVNPWQGLSNVTFQDAQKVRGELTPGVSNDADGVSFDIDLNFGGAILKSLTSWDDTSFVSTGSELDDSELVYSSVDSTIAIETWTQELQLQSAGDGPFDWITGAFYYHEESVWFFGIDFFGVNGLPEPSRYVEVNGDIKSTAFGAYGQFDYQFAEDWTLTAGVRYSRDEKELLGDVFVPPIVDPPFVAISKDDWDKVTGKLGIQYRFNDDLMAYASLSNGYKAGGFNAGSLQTASYDPETVDALEGGFKSQWLSNRLQANVVAFYYDYKDKQEYQIEVISTILKNAGAATVKGVEVELVGQPTDTFSLGAAFTFLSAKYDEFDTADPVQPELGVQDLSGNTLTRTPEYKIYLEANYDWDMRLGRLTAHLDWSWVGEQYYRPYNLPRDKQGAYDRGNARLILRSANGKWSGEAYVKNITDEDIVSNLVVYSPGLGGLAAGEFLPPRTYGVKFSYQY